MKTLIPFTLLLLSVLSTSAQNDTIYGMNFTTGNLQFASLQISSGNTTLYGNGPITPDIFQGGVYDFDPFNKRYFYPRGSSNAVQLITIDALTGSILNSPILSNPTPSVIPITNIAYNWINDTLYGIHHAYENGQTVLRFAWADIKTGTVDIVNNTPISTSPYIAGNSDIDPINGRYFLINGSSIKTVDIHTGQVVTNASIQFPLGSGREFLVNIAYNWANGLVYGLYMYPDTAQNATGSFLKLATVDPGNGQLSIVSKSPLSRDGFSAGDCDIDVIGNRYFYIRQGDLYLVNISTGALMSTQSIQNPNNAIAPIINMAYDDLRLPQTGPAALALRDTIFKLPGETIQINAYVSQSATYNWSNGSIASSISTNQPGIYAVMVEVDGFEIYGASVVVDKITSSIRAVDQLVNIYPNPSTGMLTLELSSLADDRVQLDLLSLDGKLMMTKRITPNLKGDPVMLDIQDLPKGYYTLRLITKDVSSFHKILLR